MYVSLDYMETTGTWGPNTKYQVNDMEPLHLTGWMLLI